MNLIDLITGNAGNQVAAEAENKFGISQNQVIALLAVAAPLVISYLKNKSQDANEAEALNKALDRDHDGSILDNPAQAAERQQEGGSILDHIFGGQKATVENQLSQNTGISMEKIGPILAMLAPIIGSPVLLSLIIPFSFLLFVLTSFLAFRIICFFLIVIDFVFSCQN